MNGTKTNLNIYFSAACNMNCSYCCANKDFPENFNNNNIRAALVDGSFAQHVIRKCQEYQPITLGIWGLEPTINQDLWGQFIITILNQYSNIKGIFMPTNGVSFNYDSWVKPLESWCTINQKKIKLWIQFSIDGPYHKYTGANNLINCCRQYKTNQYFKLKLSTKSTFDEHDIYQNQQQWWDYMLALKDLCNQHAQPGCDTSLIGAFPTLKLPGSWTKEDGIQWATWHPPVITNKVCFCEAGQSSLAIDYVGRIYDCQLLRNYDTTDVTLESMYPSAVQELIENQSIPKQDINKLYNQLTTQFCWAIMQDCAPDHIYNLIQVWGNGAVPISEE